MEYLFEPQKEHGRLFEIEFVQAKNQANKLSGGHPRVPTSCLSIRLVHTSSSANGFPEKDIRKCLRVSYFFVNFSEFYVTKFTLESQNCKLPQNATQLSNL